MAYAVYDFSESLDRAKVAADDIKHVIAAWGGSDEGYGDWAGGFLFETGDGRFGYLTGWCDTSGWGCQDGASVYYYDTPVIDRTQLPRWYADDGSTLGVVEWDESPADLNRYLEAPDV